MAVKFLSSAFNCSREECSQILFDSRRRTVAERDDLLDFLDVARSSLIEMYSGKEINLGSSAGNVVNGVHFPGELNKAIIFLHGNGSFYESAATRPLHWKESLKDSSGNTPHLLVFNPSGTGKSSGSTEPQTVAENLATVFNYLLEQGVDPNHIVIAGHSMGAYFTAIGAHHIQGLHEEKKINVLLDRSFWNLHSIVDSKVEKHTKGRLSSAYQKWQVHAAIDKMDWARDSIKALEGLRGRVCVVYHKKDGVVLYPNSFHTKLSQSERNRSYHCIEMVEEDPEVPAHGKYHNREYSEAEDKQILSELRIMLGMEPEETVVQVEHLLPTIKV